ncbi:MAG: hypothetical protein C0514_02605 [Candidatus Puniceispirillum sp.]|nr:hypothetical protein [Candidatus Puniceispirillum sp.]
MTSYDFLLGAYENEASWKLIRFTHEQDFTLERMEVLADCGFMTAQLQAILTYEHDQSLRFTVNMLRGLAPLFKANFLRKDHDPKSPGIQRFEETQSILHFVQDKGLPATLNVARVVNTLPANHANMRMFTQYFDFLNGLSLLEERLLCRLLETGLAPEEATFTLREASWHKRDLDHLLTLPHLLLIHYVPAFDAFNLTDDERGILERLARDCPEGASRALNVVRCVEKPRFCELGPIACLDLPPLLRAGAIKARSWLLPHQHGADGQGGTIDPERLFLFQKLMEDRGAQSISHISTILSTCQETQPVRDVVDAHVSPKWRGAVLSYYTECKFDQSYLRPLARGLDRAALSYKELLSLMEKFREKTINPDVFTQAVGLPLR